MSAVLLAPHADDETLFAFYTLLRSNADVLVCLSSGDEREKELAAAMKIAGRRWMQINDDEKAPNWDFVRDQIASMAAPYDEIIAPAFEGGGHEHHNEVALVAATLGKPLTSYYTYERGQGRTKRGVHVVASAAERVLKRRAMDCYKSQIDDEKTAPWFKSGWQAEYVERT